MPKSPELKALKKAVQHSSMPSSGASSCLATMVDTPGTDRHYKLTPVITLRPCSIYLSQGFSSFSAMRPGRIACFNRK